MSDNEEPKRELTESEKLDDDTREVAARALGLPDEQLPNAIVERLRGARLMYGRLSGSYLTPQLVVAVLSAHVPLSKIPGLCAEDQTPDTQRKAPPKNPAQEQWARVPPGTPVLATWADKDWTGTLVGVCGGKETGKLRIALDGDEKQYREVPAEDVGLAPGTMADEEEGPEEE